MTYVLNPFIYGVSVPTPSGFYALVYSSVNQSKPTAGALSFDLEVSDIEGVHDTVTNNDRVTVPATWNGRYGMITFGMGVSAPTPGTLTVYKNGASFIGSATLRFSETAGNDFGWAASAPTPFSIGDYFTLHGENSGDYIADSGSWFQVEILPTAYDGAMAKRSSNQTLSAAVSTTIEWNAEEYDLGGWHDNVTNPDRLTVPIGTTLAQVVFSASTQASHVDQMVLNGWKNGAAIRGMPLVDKNISGIDSVQAMSAPIACIAGDYFQTRIYLASGGDIGAGNDTWMVAYSLPSDLKYCIVYRLTTFAIPSGSTPTTIDWDAEHVDTDNFHDIVLNTSRLTVPIGSGLTKVRVMFSIQGASITGQWGARILKNGVMVQGGAQSDTDTSGTDSVYGCSGILDVVEGDYFEIQAYSTSANSVAATDLCWACIMEVRNPV